MVLLDCDNENIASYKTMEALEGIRINEYYSEEEKCIVLRYSINVSESINNYEHKLLQKKYKKGV